MEFPRLFPDARFVLPLYYRRLGAGTAPLRAFPRVASALARSCVRSERSVPADEQHRFKRRAKTLRIFSGLLSIRARRRRSRAGCKAVPISRCSSPIRNQQEPGSPQEAEPKKSRSSGAIGGGERCSMKHLEG